MKNLILLCSFLTLNLNAQSNLKFDKRFVECEDQWVTLQMDKDSTYIFGFIYIDEQAGLTINNEGTFKYNADKTLKVEKITETNIKIRLEPNNVRVAIIPETMYNDLKIKTVPDWLKFYKTNEGTPKRLYQWGYMYNGWNECGKALTFLVKAKEKEPTYKGLNVELAFSYNCLKAYDKAEAILEEEMTLNPSDAYVNKEYIYTLTKNKKIEKATQQFKNSIKTVKDKTYHAENCFNILQYYYNDKDKKGFDVWYKELSNWPNENALVTKYAEQMKADLK